MQDDNRTADVYHQQRGGTAKRFISWAGGKKRAGNFAFWRRGSGHWEAGIVVMQECAGGDAASSLMR